MKRTRPTVFVGSSAEGLQVAKAVQAELQYCAECVIWSQEVFGLGEGTLESLVKALNRYDFAVLVLTPDDLVTSRGNSAPAPRDNVLLELGMFIGAIGREPLSWSLTDRQKLNCRPIWLELCPRHSKCQREAPCNLRSDRHVLKSNRQ